MMRARAAPLSGVRHEKWAKSNENAMKQMKYEIKTKPPKLLSNEQDARYTPISHMPLGTPFWRKVGKP